MISPCAYWQTFRVETGHQCTRHQAPQRNSKRRWHASQVFRTLRAGPYTRSLAYDPESEFLASVSAEGTLQIWNMGDGKVKHAQKRVAPKVRPAAQPCEFYYSSCWGLHIHLWINSMPTSTLYHCS